MIKRNVSIYKSGCMLFVSVVPYLEVMKGCVLSQNKNRHLCIRQCTSIHSSTYSNVTHV